MKILAFVDLHGSNRALSELKEKAKKADIVICAGDISIFEENLDIILSKLNKFNLPILMIHGNHEDPVFLEKKCKKFKNIEFIHKKTKTIDDILFLGYGGGGFAKKDREFELWAKNFKNLKNKKFVLITHAPPYKTKVDELVEGHAGNVSIRKFIEETKPLAAICGHLHENDGRVDNIGKTKVINPSYRGKIITL